MHLASPVVLGAHGAAVARRLGLPTVAVYRTDLPSYARAYRFGQAGEALHCGRLSAEKRPQRSLTTLATLCAAGLPARLVVAGDGPLRARLVRRAARTGLPVTFAGFLSGRAEDSAARRRSA